MKVSINIKARKFVEKVSVIDKIPVVVKLHEKFGNLGDFDEKTRRMKWNLGNLNSGETRVFSYIVYSKIAVVGKFELPSVIAVYEKEGKIHETESKKVYFMNEVGKQRVE